VHTPELVVWVEIRDRFAFLHAGQQSGAGGIPVGSAERRRCFFRAASTRPSLAS
jgi:adenylyl- and sulfurtransferase ThiI